MLVFDKLWRPGFFLLVRMMSFVIGEYVLLFIVCKCVAGLVV